MRTDDAPESENVEDRRGMKSAGIAAGGGGILLVILGLIFGVDLGGKKPVGGGGDEGGGSGAPADPATKKFVSKVLGTTETVWAKEFQKMRKSYEKPKLVMFTNAVKTGGCGDAPSAVGPFYCPADSTVYIDMSFFDELEGKLGGSKAEFSQAYVIAHEVGHHVQNLLGYSSRTDAKRKTAQENEFSLRLELQADYLAGVWANHADKEFRLIESGDVESAMKTANSIGDDRLQKRAGINSPSKYNHGTSKQRMRYFTEGMKTGDSSKARLDLFFDEEKTRFDGRVGELIDSR